ncbi:MAG: DUF222 domain-containing protein [Gammaproteobacteria bacterium]
MQATDRAAPEPTVGVRPLADIEAEITTLAANINAATYRWLVLIAEFDRRAGWEGIGILSCAHWLNWRCGVDLGAAREKVRVARALEALPRIGAAFASGTLSYSKVRAMTRIATTQNEDWLLMIARHGTAAHVEKLVRGYRRSVRLAEAGRARAAHENRYLRYHYDDDGTLVLEARLPAEVGALVLKALDAADQALRADGGIDAAETREWSRLLRERAGMAELAAVAAPTVEAADKRDIHAETRPALGGDVSAETSQGAGHAHREPIEIATHAQRRADALAALAEAWLAGGEGQTGGPERYQVMLHVDAGAYARHADGRCDVDGHVPLAVDTLRRLGCDCDVLVAVEDGAGHVLDIGRRTRAIPPAMRRALIVRDHGCRFPGCTAHRFVDGHHIDHWAAGGATRLDNLVLLCRRHHRLVHEGGWSVTALAGGAIEFDAPGRGRVPATPALPSADADLRDANARLGCTIDPRTGEPRWYGERMDYGAAIGHLWSLAEHQPAEIGMRH